MKKVDLSDIGIEDRKIIEDFKHVKFRHKLFGVNEEDVWALIAKIERYYETKYESESYQAKQEIAELKSQLERMTKLP